MDLVSGWSEGDVVYLVERPGDDVRIRKLPARWSAFFQGMDDDDRKALQRSRSVTGLTHDGRYTRIDFRNRWERKDAVYRISERLKVARAAGDYGGAILEADVNPLRRLLSDNGNLNVSATPRLAWLDLETDSRAGITKAVEGKARVLCWTLTNVACEVIDSQVLELDTDAAERALIENLLTACRPYDVLLAWGGDNFDFPVLEKRAAKIRAMPGGRHPLWNRWCWLDAMETFRKYHAHVHESGEEKMSVGLNAIAQAVLGEGKKEFDASRTWEEWEAGGERRQRLRLYNVQDAILMPKIEQRTGYVALHAAVCSVTRCFPDSMSLRATQQGDGYLLRLGEIHGYRWPTRENRGDETFEKFAGAYVMEPTRLGIIENVHVADFAGLYPSIMRSWNISPETALFPKQPDPPEGSARLPYERAKLRFSKAKRGMFPLALDELVSRRAEYSRQQDEAEPGSPEWEHFKRLSGAYKIVNNSFYGIMGSPWGRFYDSSAAEAVTQTGAWLVKYVAAQGRKIGAETFYSDTDSCMVSGERESFADLVKSLNGEWAGILAELGCGECRIKLEFEKSYARLVLISAKRYAGRFSVFKGKPVSGYKIEVKGLEYKRGDSMRLTRDMQKELIDILLADDLPGVDVAREFVARWRRRILEDSLTVEEVVLSQGVKDLEEYKQRYSTAKCTGPGKKKCAHVFPGTDVGDEIPDVCPKCGTERKLVAAPVHVRVARVLEERGEEVRAGNRIEYLIVSGQGKTLDAVPAWDDGALERIDRTYYWE